MCLRKDVSDYIGRGGYVANDAHTLLWARFQPAFKSNTITGGGNLLIAQGCFTSLAYLGKVYDKLLGATHFATKEKEDAATKLHKDFTSREKALCQTRRAGDVNEEMFSFN